MTRYSSTMTEALQEVREGFSTKQIKMAIGIASDKRYAGGNMTGAVNAIEKIKRGLSDHPQVAAVLKRQNEDLEEGLDLDELKMDDPKLVRKFDKLKRGDTVKLKTSSTISKGTDFVDYVVKAKNTVNKGRVEKITLVTKGNEKAVKKFLYKRDGKVTFAIGDMGASIDDIKEKLGKDADAGDYIDDFKKSDAPQFKGKSDKKKRDMAIAAYLDAKDKKEEVELDEAKSQGMFIVLEKGSKNKVIGQFKDKKKAIDMMKKNAGSKVIQIGKFATLDDKPVDIKVGDELSYTRVKLSKKIKEEVELDEAKYDLYHKDFSSAMQHAYAMAKKLHGITIDPKEIDNKVATGPRKPGTGKTNTYRLKGDKGNIQIQVYNKGGSKPFELNMYKEGLDKDDEPTVKKVVKMLKKASNAHASQAKDLEKDLKDEKELDEAVKYKFVAIDRLGKVIGFASDEKDAKDMARRGHTMDSPSKGKGVVGRNKAKVVKLKKPMSDKQGDMMINRDFDMNKFGGETTYSIGLKEEDKPDKPDSAKAVDQARDDKKKTRIAQLQLQIAKASEMINKLNSQEKPDA